MAIILDDDYIIGSKPIIDTNINKTYSPILQGSISYNGTSTATAISAPLNPSSISVSGKEILSWDANYQTLRFPEQAIFSKSVSFYGNVHGDFIMGNNSFIPDSVLKRNPYVISLEQKLLALEVRMIQAENNIAFRP